MPCEPIPGRNGRSAGYMCSRGPRPKPPPCYKCGKPSTHLCDYRDYSLISEPKGRPDPDAPVAFPSPNTCDRPMCAACRNAAGNGLDYCDEHNNEFCRERSAYADELYREQLRKYGIDEGG